VKSPTCQVLDVQVNNQADGPWGISASLAMARAIPAESDERGNASLGRSSFSGWRLIGGFITGRNSAGEAIPKGAQCFVLANGS
jgi:hypothetical protein